MKINAVFIFPFIIVSLLLATWSGWIRIGWNFPITQLAAHHGAMMTGSFLSTLIFLERAVTFKQRWVLLLPLINGLSLIAFIAGNAIVAQVLLLSGSIGFCIMCLHFIYKYGDAYFYLFFIGACSLSIGHWLLIRSQFYPQAVPWWMGFLLFTIVAERLELTRYLQVSKRQKQLLFIALALAIIGLIVPYHLYGSSLFAIGIALSATWLFRFDMAFKSTKKPGQHRYSGILLIAGYCWLIITSVFLLTANSNAFWYDATLHAFFIGFVFSMIFSHAPIILPAVLKLPVKPYRPVLYAWFIVLQASLIARLAADVMLWVQVRKIAGLVNGLAILLFFITMILIIRSELVKYRAKTNSRNLKLTKEPAGF